jgi:predicted transcriptional regulator of viral defense system
LTFRAGTGKTMPFKVNQSKTGTRDFFAGHPVFSLGEATAALSPPGGRRGTVERLKHHLEKGRLKLVAREIYAVVPPHIEPAQFHPDPLLTAVAVRADAVFSHHSALELLGAAHSVWNQVTLYTGRRRRSLRMNGSILRFMEHPGAMQSISSRDFGTRRVERRGKILTATGPERTLVEGFRRPALAGGREELVLSAGGYSTIDLDLLEEVLNRYGIANLWAATGWFLERFQASFYVSDEVLSRLERRRPRSPQYLERSHRGGWLASRWNLILPNSLKPAGGVGEP